MNQFTLLTDEQTFGSKKIQLLKEIEDFLTNDIRNGQFFQLYSFTTENINGYLSLFDLKNKSLLTVGSSADQTINAIFSGCEDITFCDICPLTEYYFYLKTASLLSLSREEFLSFLCETKFSPNFLSKYEFFMIKSTLKNLDYDSYQVWEFLFQTYTRTILRKLFNNDIQSPEIVIHCNRYLKNDYNYGKTKNTITNSNINFINGDITDTNFGRNFDNIWLSNVAHYLKYNRIMQMVEHVSESLNIDGKLLLCYYWNTCMTVKGFPIEELEKKEYEKIKIPGTAKENGRNSVLVYQKRK